MSQATPINAPDSIGLRPAQDQTQPLTQNLPLDFDVSKREFMKMLETPAGKIEHHLMERTAHMLVRTGYNGLAGFLGALAEDNDVDSLRMFLVPDISLEIKERLSRTHVQSVACSVAHMLVKLDSDLAGQEKRDFALLWLDTFMEGESISNQLYLNLKIQKESIHGVQQVMGLVDLCPDLFEYVPLKNLKPGQKPQPPVMTRIFQKNLMTVDFGTQVIQDAQILSAILAKTHPDRLPDLVGFLRDGKLFEGEDAQRYPEETPRMPLAEAMWRDESGLARMLQVIDMTYDKSNAQVFEQVNQGFRAAAADAKIPLSDKLGERRLEMIEKGWVDQESLKTLLASQFRIFQAASRSSFNEVNVDFLQAFTKLANTDESMAVRWVQALGKQGLDLTANFETVQFAMGEGSGCHPIQRDSCTLLDVAVITKSPDLFKILLAAGADPTQSGWSLDLAGPKAKKEPLRSAKEALLGMSVDPDGSKQEPLMDEMRQVLQVWLAHQAAKVAIAEIEELSRSCAVQP